MHRSYSLNPLAAFMEGKDRLRQEAGVLENTTANNSFVCVSGDQVGPTLECVVSAGTVGRHLQVGEYLLWMS